MKIPSATGGEEWLCVLKPDGKCCAKQCWQCEVIEDTGFSGDEPHCCGKRDTKPLCTNCPLKGVA